MRVLQSVPGARRAAGVLVLGLAALLGRCRNDAPPSGLGGRAPFAPDSLRQFGSDSVAVLATGVSTAEQVVVVRGSLADPDGADPIRLEVEVRPVGTAFTGTANAVSSPVPPGRRAFVTVDHLSDNASYHWQARSVDQTELASAWVAFGGNAETEPDVTIAVPEPPAASADLGQFQSDGTAPLPAGGSTEERTVLLKATPSDPDPGDLLRLEVEVRAVGTAFTNVPTGSSSETSSGTVAGVPVTDLGYNVAYHWQARAVDQTGRAGAWAVFGENDETATDFKVLAPATALIFAVQPTNTLAGATITPAIQITAHDEFGNTATTFTGQVTVALGADPGGTLSGITTVNAIAGVATFSNLSIDKVGTGYALVASATGLAGATSAGFNVAPAGP